MDELRDTSDHGSPDAGIVEHTGETGDVGGACGGIADDRIEELAIRAGEGVAGNVQHDGALAFAQVFADGLTGDGGVAEDTEQVILHLESDAHGCGVLLEGRLDGAGGIGQQGAEQQRAAHGIAAGLQSVERLDLTHASDDIDLLAADDVLLDLGEQRQGADHAIRGCVEAREHIERQGGGVVASEDRGGISELPGAVVSAQHRRDTRSAAAKVVAVHPVVVHEQVGLEQLERDSRVERRIFGVRVIMGQIADQDERRTQAFSAAQRQVTNRTRHGFDVCAVAHGIRDTGVEVAGETGVDVVPNPVEQRGECVGWVRTWHELGYLRHRGRGDSVGDVDFVVVIGRALNHAEGRLGGAAHPVNRLDQEGAGAEPKETATVSERTISERKTQHIDIACNEDVTFKTTGTLLDGVRLIHEALPDLSLDDLDTRVELFGKTLRAPIVIAGMTGGSERSKAINWELASLAQRRGYGFGLGSQRPMVQHPELLGSYAVREVAPDVLLLGNIGVIQARGMTTRVVAKMAADVGADALCVHMNPAMELVQPEGDRDFRGGLETMRRLAQELGIPVVAKETGCGISFATARRLVGAGITAVDVSGAGGTSWVAVETKRAAGQQRELGELFREWGIPTAASVMMTTAAGMRTVIATGGIETGLDIARSIVIGASAGGMARVVLKALEHGGQEEADALLDRVERELRTTMLLVGARNIDELRKAPRILSASLESWATTAKAVRFAD